MHGGRSNGVMSEGGLSKIQDRFDGSYREYRNAINGSANVSCLYVYARQGSNILGVRRESVARGMKVTIAR